MNLRLVILASTSLAAGVLVRGWDEFSTRCELCDSTSSYIASNSDYSRTLIIDGFSSKSDDYEFYVRVDIEHTYLGDLRMFIRQGSSTSMTIWNYECSSSDDLGAIFYDSASSTVESQGDCGKTRENIVYARPDTLFSNNDVGRTPDGTYVFQLFDEASGDEGYLYEVCVGFFDEEGCTFSGSTSLNEDNDDNDGKSSNNGNDVAFIVSLTISISVFIFCICVAFYIKSMQAKNKNEQRRIDSQMQGTVQPMEIKNHNTDHQSNGGGKLEMANNGPNHNSMFVASKPAAVSATVAPMSAAYDNPGAMGMDFNTYPSTSTVQTEAAPAAGFESTSNVYQSTAEGFGHATREGDGFHSAVAQGEAPPAYDDPTPGYTYEPKPGGETAEAPPAYGAW